MVPVIWDTYMGGIPCVGSPQPFLAGNQLYELYVRGTAVAAAEEVPKQERAL